MLRVTVNGKEEKALEGETVSSLAKRLSIAADVYIRNGFAVEGTLPLRNGDQITLIEKGKMPDKAQLERMMAARHTPYVHERVKKATVGIAGLGGLGSNIAVMLARTGVGRLILADFDLVEPSNLNRQSYLMRHLGRPKTEALKEQIGEINPYVSVDTHTVRVEEANAAALFGDCDVVCEAFDDPASKATLVSALLEGRPKIKLVAASGMAGFESANSIKTVRRFENLYLCGDGTNEAREGNGLMAPRVTVCAAHQANMALRLLLGITEV